MGTRMNRLFGNSSNFRHALKDYLENSSIGGLMYYLAPGTRSKERIFWLVAHAVCLIFLAFMTVGATMSFWGAPTVTTEETSRYPIHNIAFPGVAVCDVNVISYSAAVKLAGDILEYKNKSILTHQEVTHLLKYLGHLYVHELNDGENDLVDSLHQLLTERFNGTYVPGILKKLVPPCHEMMEYCSWGGEPQNCKEIFSVEMTSDGWCCTFNHIHRRFNFGKNDDKIEFDGFLKKIRHSDVPGSQFGLTILLQSDVRNHHYKTLPIMGHTILINSPLDLPDPESGGTRRVVISHGMEVSLTIDAIPFHSVPEVARYTPKVRRCIFSDHYHRTVSRFYFSFNDCIARCRALSMKKYCKCTPFYYMDLMESSDLLSDHQRTCDLQDLPCFKQYKEKFVGIRQKSEMPGRHNRIDIFEHDGFLGCIACNPNCEDIAYQVSVSSAPLTAPTVWMGKQIYKIDGHSIVNIFFQHPSTIRLKHDVLYEWYDLMSNYGGLCGLFLGVSVITFAEFFYFITLRLYKREDEFHCEKRSQIVNVEPAMPHQPQLYWNEIQPNAVK